MRRLFPLFILLLLAMRLTAQPAALNLEHFGSAQGFSTDEMTCMARDPQGFLWFGTTNGLNFFDGQNVKVFRHHENDSTSLPGNMIFSLAFDKKGRMWVGTSLGISLYDAHAGRFKTFDTFTADKERAWCHHIFVDHDGVIWFTSIEGLGRIDPGNFSIKTFHLFGSSEQFGHGKLLNGILEAQDRKLWIGTLSGAWLFDRSTQTFSHVNIPRSNLAETSEKTDNEIQQLFEDKDGTIWICTWGSGLRHYHPTTGAVETYLYNHNSETGRGNVVRSITRRYAQGDDQLLWLATSDSGIVAFDQNTKKFTVYRRDPAKAVFAPADCGYIFNDGDDILWILGPKGIDKIDPRSNRFDVHPLSFPQFPATALRSVEEIYWERGDASHNRAWLVMDLDGLLLYDRRTQHGQRLYASFEAPKSVANTACVRTMLQDTRGRIWLGNDYGLYLLDTISGKSRWFRPCGGDGSTVVKADFVGDIGEDKNGKLWLATNNGLVQFDPVTETFHTWYPVPVADPTPEENRIHYLLVASDGKIWYATHSRGIGYFDPVTEKFTSCEKTVPVISAGGWDEDADGNIWIGDSHGLYEWNPKTQHYEVFRSEQGMGDDQVYHALRDDQGLMWASTRNGLSSIDPVTHKITTYQTEDGLQTNLVDRALNKGPDGAVYIGGLDEFREFHPAQLKTNPQTRPAVMTGFRVLEQTQPIDFESAINTPMEVSYRQNILTFEFAAPNYSHAEKNQYAYMLEGFDKNWVQAGHKMSATYTNLDGGDYVFKVITANADGTWNKTPALFRIHVIPPFWKTLWFRLLLLLAAALIVLLIYRYNIRRIRKEEQRKTDFNRKVAEAEMKALRAQMNPHFIFNCMNTIDSFVMNSDYENASSFLNKFSKLIRMVLENSTHRLITIESDCKALNLYLELERLRFGGHFDVSMEVDEALLEGAYRIPPLLLQPYAENAILHGLRHKEGKGHLRISLKLENEMLLTIIEDDGVGRARSAELKAQNRPGHRSLGTQVTNERIEIFNFTHEQRADVRIIDLHDASGKAAGTRVEVRLPLLTDDSER